jgi:hypothetical protein
LAHPWVIACVVLAYLALFAWLIPRIYRALRAEWRALGTMWRGWFG